ncbi:MAG: hypothetical protein GEU26_17010 [Nitrososphaeraceae archaeon]|nr:hypothetical protein [Nitrososphaeraceae archaeon]
MKQYLAVCGIAIIAVAMIGTTMMTYLASYAVEKPSKPSQAEPAVIAASDENVYVVWGNNDTANNNSEVMFRASVDGGQTYGDKVNLSNSSGSNSTDFDVQATIDNVIVSWWETNQTSTEPVIVFSGDRGATFGPIMRLASNGTIGGSLR